MAKKQSSKKPDPTKLPVPANAPPEKVKINPIDPPPPIGGPPRSDKPKAT